MGGIDNFLNSFGTQDAPDAHGALEDLVERPGTLDAFVNDFGGQSESYFFYNSTEELRFERSSWTWYRVDPELGNVTPLYGVTNIVKRADNPAALIPWAAKMTIEKLLRIVPTVVKEDSGLVDVYIPEMSLAAFTALCIQAKSAHKDVFEDAGDVGHIAHECLEKNIKKALLTPEKKVQELTDLPKDERAVSCAKSAKGWMDAHNVRWVETETKVYSKEYQYAGTMDGLCIVDSCPDPACCATAFKDVLSVADWKSSNRLRVSYVFQVAAYKHAKLEEDGGQIPDCWILRLGKEDEEFEPWHLTTEDFEDDFAGYLACLNLFKIVSTVEDRVSAQKHNVTVAKKAQRAAAKALAEAEEKLRKATEKAEKKLKQAEEKAKVKAEVKAEREKLKKFVEAALEYLPKEEEPKFAPLPVATEEEN